VLLRVVSDTTACGDSSGSVGSSGGSGGVAVLSGANASSAVVWEVLPRSTTLYTPSLPADGMYAVFVRAVDDAGNVGDVTNVTLWRDATPPSAPPVLVRTPDAVTQSTDALFEVRSGDVTSPGQASLWYQLVSNGVPATPSLVAVPVLPATPSSVVSLSLSSLATDTSHLVRFVSRDQLGRTSSGETLFSWRVVSAAPAVVLLRQPANISSLLSPRFVFSTRWQNAEVVRSAELSLSTFQVQLLGVAGDLGAWHAPCRFAVNASACVTVQRHVVRVQRCTAGAGDGVVHAAGARGAVQHDGRGDGGELDVPALQRRRVRGAERRRRRRGGVCVVSQGRRLQQEERGGRRDAARHRGASRVLGVAVVGRQSLLRVSDRGRVSARRRERQSRGVCEGLRTRGVQPV
jgi:hypothetical protein